MSHQFISPEEVRSWEKVRDLAKECMKASQGERPEVRRLKILYVFSKRTVEFGTRLEHDVL